MTKEAQQEFLRRKLLEPGTPAVEYPWQAAIWDGAPSEGDTNVLGRLLMKIRAELRLESPERTTRQ